MVVPNGLTVNGKVYVTSNGYFVTSECIVPDQSIPKIGSGFYPSNFYDYMYEYDSIGDAWSSKQQTTNPQWTYGRFATDTDAYIVGAQCNWNHAEVIPVTSITCGNPIREGQGSTQTLQKYNPISNSWGFVSGGDTFSAPSQYPGTQYDMSASVTIRHYPTCGAFENKGYIHTRFINGRGVIEYNPITDSYSVYSTQEGYDFPSGWAGYAAGGITPVV